MSSNHSCFKLDTKNIILDEAIPLFAKRGYSNVSMRDIAEVVGIRAPALYNHFKNKQALYLAAISHAFANKAAALSAVFATPATPPELLQKFVVCLCESVSQDPNFRLLIQRELLDGDEARLQVLAKEIFAEQFETVKRLAEQLDPNCDAHMLTISIIGLVLHHFELGPLRRLFPGSRAEHEDPQYIAKHITRLLLKGVVGAHEHE
jgi:AcrR family transcriptional regulator